MSEPKMTYSELCEIEDAIRALKQQQRVCAVYLQDAPDEPETGEAMRLYRACGIAVVLLDQLLKAAENE